MSARGSTAKISSLSSMSPPLPASRVCTLTFILAFLALVGFGLCPIRRSFRCFILCRLFGRGLGRSAGFLLGGDRCDFLVARERRDLMDCGVVDQARLTDVHFRVLHGLEYSGRVRRVVRARKLDSVANRQPAALVRRDGALDEQEAADRVRADDFEVLLRTVPGAHVAG